MKESKFVTEWRQLFGLKGLDDERDGGMRPIVLIIQMFVSLLIHYPKLG